MTDHPALAQLSAFVDEETTPEEREALTAHLAACQECRQRHEELLAVAHALAPLGTMEPAPDLLGDLRRRIATPPARRGSWTWALAAVVLLAMGLLMWRKPWGTTPAPIANPGIPPSAPHTVQVKEPAPLLPVRLAVTTPARNPPAPPAAMGAPPGGWARAGFGQTARKTVAAGDDGHPPGPRGNHPRARPTPADPSLLNLLSEGVAARRDVVGVHASSRSRRHGPSDLGEGFVSNDGGCGSAVGIRR